MRNSVLVALATTLAFSAAGFAAEKKKAAAAPAPEAKRMGAVEGQPDSDACGLGWQVTQSKTLIATTTRGTTNWVIPYSFGMTSGTMGCAQHPFAKKDQEAAAYAVTNYEPLLLEMAEGHGETLAGFARTMGCGDAVYGDFSRMTQEKYQDVTGGKASAVRMMFKVKEEIRRNPVLARGCA